MPPNKDEESLLPRPYDVLSPTGPSNREPAFDMDEVRIVAYMADSSPKVTYSRKLNRYAVKSEIQESS